MLTQTLGFAIFLKFLLNIIGFAGLLQAFWFAILSGDYFHIYITLRNWCAR